MLTLFKTSFSSTQKESIFATLQIRQCFNIESHQNAYLVLFYPYSFPDNFTREIKPVLKQDGCFGGGERAEMLEAKIKPALLDAEI